MGILTFLSVCCCPAPLGGARPPGGMNQLQIYTLAMGKPALRVTTTGATCTVAPIAAVPAAVDDGDMAQLANQGVRDSRLSDEGDPMSTRVAINGFGRIGRAFLRSAIERNAALDVVAVHDVAGADVLAHLLERDSV
jgi:glutamate dehydrogenase/leucine dehydrogenase